MLRLHRARCRGSKPGAGATLAPRGCVLAGLLGTAALAVCIDTVVVLNGTHTSGILLSAAQAGSKGENKGAGGGDRGDRQGDQRGDQGDQRGDRQDGSKGDQPAAKDGKTGGGQPEGDAQGPPSTVGEMLERIFKPATRRSATRAPSAGLPNWGEPIGNRSYSNSEVLAVNLSSAAVKKAQDFGFSVAPPSPLSYIKSTVTTLLPPTGMDANQARDFLQRSLPTETFALNRIYRVYRAANKDEHRRARRTEPASPAGVAVPCKGDHCAGRGLIDWKDHLLGCSVGLSVGVIDTGVDHEHPAFASDRLRTGSFLPEGRSPAPTWHGTGVLALLAGNQQSGTPGLIARADFFLASVFFADSTGDFATDTLSVLKALDWIDAFKVKLVNMSFAGPKDELLQKAIATLSAKGVVFVAAAGNEGPTAGPSYPAAYKEVIAVTAVNKDLRNYPYANRGDYIDVAAPGVDIWTAVPGFKEGYYSGTSFAAPYVTAILATIYAGSPRHLKEELLARLEVKDLGPPGRDPIYGRGLLVAPNGCKPEARTATAAPPAAIAHRQTSVGLPTASPAALSADVR